MFMTPRKHLLQDYGKEVVCSNVMAPMYQLGDYWYHFTRSMYKATKAHELQPLHTGQWTYENPGKLGSGVIYTDDQLSDLRKQIMFPSERQAINNLMAKTIMGDNIDRQGFKLSNLIDDDYIESFGNLRLDICSRSSRYLGNWIVYSFYGN